MSRRRRALLLQFTEPQRFPPIQHIAQILLAAGWDVELSCCEIGDGHAWPFTDPVLDAATWRQAGAVGGWRGRLHYLRFLRRAAHRMRRWRPTLVYASDLFAAPLVGAARRLGLPVAFHEHDLPTGAARGWSQRWLHRARLRALRQADFLVFPGDVRRRAACDAAAVAVDDARTVVVWNLPLLSECLDAVPAQRSTDTGLRLYFHGTITPERLPLELLDGMAAARCAPSLTLVGYETQGARGHLAAFVGHAARLGLGGRLAVHGALPRESALALCRGHDLGVCCYGGDVNHMSMLGPSNKPFDYLACGVVPLVPAQAEWLTGLVTPGYAFALPDHGGAIAFGALLDRLALAPQRLHEAAVSGLAKLRREWHYEHAFMPLLTRFARLPP